MLGQWWRGRRTLLCALPLASAALLCLLLVLKGMLGRWWRGRHTLLCALPLTSAALLCLLLVLRVDNPHWHTPLKHEILARPAPDTFRKKGLSQESLRVVHLDLKGAPPKVSFLREVLGLLVAHGCTALLIEYEDMFPYQGALANLSAKNAYKQEQILELLSWARHLGLEVIPLVQTFGHMEFVLKQEQFRHMRELDPFPQEVCPKHSATLPFIQDMIQQVMSVHPWAKYLHIGCDEVYHIAACKRCVSSGMNSREIFTEHVSNVAKWVRSRYPELTPLIWDDMLRHWDPKYLSQSPLGALVEPVVWAYTENITRLVPNYLWFWYSKVFPRVWVAGAFKGAGLPTSVLPDIRTHYKNQQSWLKLLSSTDSEIAGYVLTGWSRFDHFAVLCELLPPSIPSLLLNLILLTTEHSDTSILPKWKASLKCPMKSKLTIDSSFTNHQPLASCSFLGQSAFLVTSKYMTLNFKVDKFYKSVTEEKAWMTNYNVKYNFSSPFRILENFRLTEGYPLIREVKNFKTETRRVLLEYFDDYTVDEWIEQRIQPLVNKLSHLEAISNQLISRRSWPRRPVGT